MTSANSVPSETSSIDARIAANEQSLLVQQEIWRVVSEATQREKDLSIGSHAQRIAKAFPTSGYSRKDIEDALVFAAVDNGAVVEVRPARQREIPTIDVRSLFSKGLMGGRTRKRASPVHAPTPQAVA